MNTLRSTLAVSALMLTGLVAAGHVLYPSDAASEAAVRQTMATRLQAIAAETRAAEAKAEPKSSAAQAVSADAGTASAWVDPPARMSEPAPAKLAAATPEAAAPVTQPARPSADAKKAEQVRRRTTAVASARARKAKDPADNAEVAYRTPPAPTQKIDPIGDILRGLGFGHEG